MPISEDILREYRESLRAAGEVRREAKRAHDRSVDSLARVVRNAQAEGIPMQTILDSVNEGIEEDETPLSRQWLYKMQQHRGRSSSNLPQPGIVPA